MRIYPAIDLKGGRCVRLRQGDPQQETVFSDDPVTTASRWVDEGAEWLHLVDLDGAFSGSPQNAEAIAGILRTVDVPVQLGGGLRSVEAARAALEAGVQRIILGTAAFEQPEIVSELAADHPGRVAVGIDARDGRVATHGWKEQTDRPAIDFAREMEGRGAAVIIYTDIRRDGMLEGPNVDATVALAETLSIPVIASGGVSSLGDIRSLARVAAAGIEGVIVGRALYDRAFTLREAIAAAR